MIKDFLFQNYHLVQATYTMLSFCAKFSYLHVVQRFYHISNPYSYSPTPIAVSSLPIQ